MPEGDAEGSTEPAAEAGAEISAAGAAGSTAGAAASTAGAAGSIAGASAAGAAGTERQRLEGEFLVTMRRTGSVMQLLSQAAAERIGINATDLNCLNVVALTGSMTAGELAKATGLTTASITGVLDRLEQGGFVRRERDVHDRRRVNVELNSRGLHDVASVFSPVLAQWRGAAARYTDDELRLILGFQQEVEQIMRGQLGRLRGERPAESAQ
jgi:DNA-binding MarR family transcriptional regulator